MKPHFFINYFIPFIIIWGLQLVSFPAYSSIIYVTDSADTGPGSLRESIGIANLNPGADTIYFQMPPQQHVITIKTPLPTIDGATFIDGTSLPGYFFPSYMVTVKSDSVSLLYEGIRINSDSVIIAGLHLSGFDGIGSVAYEAGGLVIKTLSNSTQSFNHVTVANCVFSENDVGIGFTVYNNLKDVLITNNVFIDNNFGIRHVGSSETTDMVIRQNSFSDEEEIRVICNKLISCTIDSNATHTSGKLITLVGHRVNLLNIIHNNFNDTINSNSFGLSIGAEDMFNVTVSGNQFNGFNNSIEIEVEEYTGPQINLKNINVSNNTISNASGIHIEVSSWLNGNLSAPKRYADIEHIVIDGNTINSGSTTYGIYFKVSGSQNAQSFTQNINIVNNIIDCGGAGDGINILFYCSGASVSDTINDLKITNNQIFNADDGIDLRLNGFSTFSRIVLKDYIIRSNILNTGNKSGIYATSNGGGWFNVEMNNALIDSNEITGFDQNGISYLVSCVNTAMNVSNQVIRNNHIYGNAWHGIYFVDWGCGSNGIQFAENSIHDNDSLGIDVDPFGNPLNDPFVPAPDLASVSYNSTQYMIIGQLMADASKAYLIEYFGNLLCDSGGFGEGMTYLGHDSVYTDVNGNAAIQSTISGLQFYPLITATATDFVKLNTSEFSNCISTALVGVTEFESGFLNLFPNPTTGILNIGMDNSINEKFVNIEVFNTVGVKCFETTSAVDNKNISIDLNSISKGAYLIYINTGERTFRQKLIKY